MYLLIRDLAADGIPVAVTCRVLKFGRAPYYRWLANPVTASELEQAYLANALFEAHSDDPEFGYRLPANEARAAGHVACDRRVCRMCWQNRWLVRVRQDARRQRAEKPGPPPHDDLVRREFTDVEPNRLVDRNHRAPHW